MTCRHLNVLPVAADHLQITSPLGEYSSQYTIKIEMEPLTAKVHPQSECKTQSV
jgi:hypothetical protein